MRTLLGFVCGCDFLCMRSFAMGVCLFALATAQKCPAWPGKGVAFSPQSAAACRLGAVHALAASVRHPDYLQLRDPWQFV